MTELLTYDVGTQSGQPALGCPVAGHADLLSRIESLSPGEALLVEGLPNHLYHSLPCPSKSTLWDFRHRGPVWYEARHILRTAPAFSSAATSLGNLVHAALELGEAYRSRLVATPEKFVTASGAFSTSQDARAWRAEQGADALVATPAEAAICERMLEQFHLNAASRDLYERVTHHELSCIARLETGHLLRCRYDALTEDGYLLDWKSTKEKHPLRTFSGACMEHGYHYASALYSMLARLSGLSDRRLTFVAMSTTPEHEVQVVEIPESLVSRCEEQVLNDLEEIDARTEAGNFLPAGYGEIHVLKFPEWAMRGDA
jgi:hypothetical protein